MASRRAADAGSDTAPGQPDWSAEQLGRRLRELRNARGLRLSDLARASGLSVSFLSQVEYFGEILCGVALLALVQATSITGALVGASALVTCAGVVVTRSLAGSD